MDRVRISHSGDPIKASIKITGSKSISNRVLILNALSSTPSEIKNLSKSDDTVTLDSLLRSNEKVLDAHHAGTTFRFMTAYLCLQKGTQVLTGSDRMKERPIGALVEALKEIGADIEYLEKEGYPPLKISGALVQKNNVIEIAADISSQFLSALCMIGPCLSEGLILKLKGELVSKPYLDMTLQLMQKFGVEATFENNRITINPQSYTSIPYTVESDWSSASYHFAIAAIAGEAEITLNNFYADSFQADAAILSFCEQLGVEASINNGALEISSSNSVTKNMAHDFITHPDIAQTIAVIAAAKNMSIKYRGLKTLMIKETDRVAALREELSKIGVTLSELKEDAYEFLQEGELNINSPTFSTYQDHRMAMAFAPLALRSPIEIENPKVVNKSYPTFWTDLQTLGFRLEFLS